MKGKCKGRKLSEEQKRRISESVKRIWQTNPDTFLKNRKYRPYKRTESTINKLKQSLRAAWKRDYARRVRIFREKVRSKITEESRKKKSITMKLKWQDPIYRLKQSAAHKGRVLDKASNWKGGKSKFNIVRHSDNYRRWVENILSRDNYTCQVCKRRGGSLRVHHIIPFSWYVSVSLSVNKDITQAIKWLIDRCDKLPGITLCKECHKKIHGGIG